MKKIISLSSVPGYSDVSLPDYGRNNTISLSPVPGYRGAGGSGLCCREEGGPQDRGISPGRLLRQGVGAAVAHTFRTVHWCIGQLVGFEKICVRSFSKLCCSLQAYYMFGHSIATQSISPNILSIK